MQLTNKKNLKALLTTATCTLLGTSSALAAETPKDEWEFDTAIMYYGETDRVTAVEAIFAGQKTFGNDQLLNLKFTFDSLTGESANGAVAQPNIQTFTRPSGNGQYQTKPKDTPLDDTFKDTRVQFTGGWTQPLYDKYTWSVGGNVSKEYDYFSLSANTNLSRDFNKKNTTVSMGLSYAFDQIEPEGDIPVGLSSMVVDEFGTPAFDELFDATRDRSSDDKTTVDLLFGVSQIINRKMVVQLNYSYSYVDGYLTDPFKVLSVVNSEGYTQEYLYENRPDSRAKHAFFGQTKYHFDAFVFDGSYRYMTDDWDIDSHTGDFRLNIPLGKGHYLEPHFRYYTQGAADFYQPFLVEGEDFGKHASADYRIGDMDTYTVGIKYGMPLNSGDSLAFRLEYYKQTPNSDGTERIGVLKELDIYEEVDAIIAQITYSF